MGCGCDDSIWSSGFRASPRGGGGGPKCADYAVSKASHQYERRRILELRWAVRPAELEKAGGCKARESVSLQPRSASNGGSQDVWFRQNFHNSRFGAGCFGGVTRTENCSFVSLECQHGDVVRLGMIPGMRADTLQQR